MEQPRSRRAAVEHPRSRRAAVEQPRSRGAAPKGHRDKAQGEALGKVGNATAALKGRRVSLPLNVGQRSVGFKVSSVTDLALQD